MFHIIQVLPRHNMSNFCHLTEEISSLSKFIINMHDLFAHFCKNRTGLFFNFITSYQNTLEISVMDILAKEK